jgi:negative regulator of replication initiation
MEIQRTALDPRPQNIPNSPYWTPTKTSTENKKEILQTALRVLGYSDEIIHSAVAKLN